MVDFFNIIATRHISKLQPRPPIGYPNAYKNIGASPTLQKKNFVKLDFENQAFLKNLIFTEHTDHFQIL